MQIDMQRREKLRRLHTATHIINYCAKKVLGNHVWQNGSNLKPDIGTLDITHFDQITQNQKQQIETLANEIVFENKKVGIEELERTKAEQQYGFELYQGGAIPMKTLRIVHIEDSDTEACGGLHMQSTGGIGIIKLIDTQKIQDGVIRLSYGVRDYAMDKIHENEQLLTNTSQIFSVQTHHLEKTAQKFFNEWREQKKQIEKLNDSLKDLAIKQILTTEDIYYELPLNDISILSQIMEQTVQKKTSLQITTQNFIATTPTIEEPHSYKKKLNKNSYIIYIK